MQLIVRSLMAGCSLAALSTAAVAQSRDSAAPTAPAPVANQLDEVVVTATARPETRIRSSITVSTLSPDRISQGAPIGAADILRNIPGIRSEASGGEGNANITVRGLPEASGGGKFVQFQEDGLPVIDFGDIAFGTADTFVRSDANLERLEVVRGGSASTFTSNAPGAIFNLISKTGTRAGGSIGVTEGLDYDRSRLDADYGGSLGDGWRFHVGGFYRVGEGVRTADYQAENGGQIKGNITKELDHGFVRLNFKYLDDRAPVYLPTPISISGSNSHPTIASLPGFSALTGTLMTPNLKTDLTLDQNGRPVLTSIQDGYRTLSRSIGGEVNYKILNHVTIDDKFAVNHNSGAFGGEYPANTATAQSLITSLGGAGATLRYANGPNAGQTIADPSTLNGNGLAVNALTFNTKINDLGNYQNILTISKPFDAGAWGDGAVTLGYYSSRQDLNLDWHWNSYLEEVKGKDAALLNVYNAAGQSITQNGLIAYGEPVFGNCCVRYYNVHYDFNAPYVSTQWTYAALTVDGSLRYDISSAHGLYAGSTKTAQIDVNGDGIFQKPELSVPTVNLASAQPVNYTKDYLSYSIGGNYAVEPELAVFARASRGARFNADRILFGGGVTPDGGAPRAIAINFVEQQEGGFKWRRSQFFAFVTAFHATTQEANQNITPLGISYINNTYESEGVEFEGEVRWGGFRLNGGATYTHAIISQDAVTPADRGHVPQRQADWVYQVTPSYGDERNNVGLNIVGTSDSYADDDNTLVMPGYVQLNVFANYYIMKNLRASLNVNNLLDTIGLTEINQSTGGVTPTGVNSARSILGRNISASLRYSF